MIDCIKGVFEINKNYSAILSFDLVHFPSISAFISELVQLLTHLFGNQTEQDESNFAFPESIMRLCINFSIIFPVLERREIGL